MDISKKQIVICIGAQKAGTSWLFKCLEEHPKICAATGKETNFFTDNASFSEYSKFFQNCLNREILFEASPLYLSDKDAPLRIRSAFEEVKIIILLRNPIDRTISHYNHLKNKSIFSKDTSLKQAVDLHPEIILNSRYSLHIGNYRKTFKPEQILILDFSEIVCNPENMIDNVCSFLDIETFNPRFIKTKYNTNSARSSPLYKKVTRLYLILSNNILGRVILNSLRKIGFDSSKNESLLSMLGSKKKTPDPTDTSWLEEILRDELSFYNNKAWR